MKYITRLCHNTSNWQRPTKSATAEKGTFFSNFGYGHEEWLFRFEWQIAGWQYGFLQGVNHRRTSLLADGLRAGEVVLFSLTPGGRRYVARIRHIEFLDDEQASDALKRYKERGWYGRMLEEIDDVSGDKSGLGSVVWASHVLNVRFRPDDVEWFPQDTYATDGDPVLQYQRYQLIQLTTYATVPETLVRRPTRKGLQLPPVHDRYFIDGGTARECSPEHSKIQEALHKELKNEYPTADIVFEENFVDVTVTTETEKIFFEIKSDLNTRRVLRLALGQLLEYAYYWDSMPGRAIKLIAVGRTAMSLEDKQYLKYLTQKFNLPFDYRQVRLPSEI